KFHELNEPAIGCAPVGYTCVGSNVRLPSACAASADDTVPLPPLVTYRTVSPLPCVRPSVIEFWPVAPACVYTRAGAPVSTPVFVSMLKTSRLLEPALAMNTS